MRTDLVEKRSYSGVYVFMFMEVAMDKGRSTVGS